MITTTVRMGALAGLIAFTAVLGARAASAQPCTAAATAFEISQDEANALYRCLSAEIAALSDGITGVPGVPEYRGWEVVSTAPLPSSTHGAMLVNHIVSPNSADLYKEWEGMAGKRFPAGAVIVKESIMIGADGSATPGPLFLMEKTAPGTAPDTDDWIYTRIFTDGRMQRTLGPGGEQLDFCHDCHVATLELFDAMFFPPERYRVNADLD